MNTDIFQKLIWIMGVAVFICVSGCGLLSSKHTEKPKLPTFTPQATIQSIWSKDLGAGSDGRAKLSPFLFEKTLWTAHYNGLILGVDPETGSAHFSFKLKDNLTTGPAVNDENIWVGTARGELIALKRSSGRILWRAALGSEVVSAPVAQDEILAIHSVDGVLHVLNANTGVMLWVTERQSPVFNLRGLGQPVFQDDKIIAGFANGKLMAFQKESGQPLWERRIAIPQGGSELSRLVDIDASPVVEGEKVYAVAYQGNLISNHVDTGDVIWHHALSSVSGMVIFDNLLVVPDESGTLFGFDKTTGAVLWEQKALQGRSLSAPIATAEFIAVADNEGMVFVLSKQDGRLIGHGQAQGTLPSSLLSYQGNQFFVLDQKGRVTLYRIEPFQK